MGSEKFPESIAECLARIHGESFSNSRKVFSSSFILSLIQNSKVVLVNREQKGFCLVRLSGREAEIITVAIRPQFQGKGIGYSILFEALQLIKETECEKIFLEVDFTNKIAIRLYSKLGFQKCGLRNQYYKNLNGKTSDALIMEKVLIDPAIKKVP
tara:strand:+ start:79 stop:546 length:468 start_codon:yes stop_codon:yes gene_type:complete